MPVSSKTIEKFQNDPTDPRHGTVNGGMNLRCKCEPCVLAAREYRRMDKLLTRRYIKCPDYLHGSWNGYCNYRCRCEPCVLAARAARNRWADNKRKRDAAVQQARLG